ncbi:FdrA family protein [Microbispora amethystogenes]|uniref:Acyl-CoA synthetase FdrA n=1 Tax=Microbispora amethystogenes TaxID=1427754 RepID=A0ABQ4FBQ5_9ACTN|nr:FdrA family protein [Microbispora amethystogenes]GIH32233.1 acyl-CoA synthetase FdrA [Microbispora amethystogenes]
MTDLVEVRPGVYHDSVTLMRVSQALTARPEVAVAVVAMGTDLNAGLARDLGFEVPPTTPGDLLVAIRAATSADLGEAAAELERQLATTGSGGGKARDEAPPRTVRSAARSWEATVALVSVPGEHAFAEALDAVEAGLSVMIFSDNVPVEQEILLKDRARARGVLVMGPDCGTAVVGGAGLGFANVLRPGPVGVVAASGTGAQQVTCLLDIAGVGVSHVLGVGGRDLSAEVGGRSAVQALRALDEDPATELIVLVSKPPAPEAARAVRDLGLATPVVAALLGPGEDDLTAVAEKALRALGRDVPEWPCWPAGEAPAREGRRPLRGLYSGGTLCAEAALIAGADTATEAGFVDFGDDAYTRGRAHPMIDPSLRREALRGVASGVVLLDVVLGHGADPDPSSWLAPEVRDAVARGVDVVVALVGADGDPQGLRAQAARLNEAGAAVFTSNAAAARHARRLADG